MYTRLSDLVCWNIWWADPSRVGNVRLWYTRMRYILHIHMRGFAVWLYVYKYGIIGSCLCALNAFNPCVLWVNMWQSRGHRECVQAISIPMLQIYLHPALIGRTVRVSWRRARGRLNDDCRCNKIALRILIRRISVLSYSANQCLSLHDGYICSCDSH